MRAISYAIALCAGCSFTEPAGAIDAPRPPIDAPRFDAPPVDAMLGPCTGTLVGTGFQICLLEPPTQMLMVPAGTIATETSAACAPASAYTSSPDVCLLLGTSVNIPMNVVATGRRPLAIVATNGAVMIGGAGGVDVSSHDAVLGAGTRSTCPGGTAPDSGGGTSGGGFAGSYGGVGGDGGRGASGGNGGIAATPGGFTRVEGGCPGGPGAGTGAGAGGAGGGAVWIIATTKIQIDGSIDASGGAGGGSTRGDNAGGGGAGAGGLIGLDAPQLMGTGNVFANGGGGGEGCGSATDGNPGGVSLGPTMAALGGTGGGNGGDGGGGSSGATLFGVNGFDGTGGDGGGGGGGGAGVVWVRTGVAGSENFAPPPS